MLMQTSWQEKRVLRKKEEKRLKGGSQKSPQDVSFISQSASQLAGFHSRGVRAGRRLRMAVWDKMILLFSVFLLAGAVDADVNYPDPVCAVEGSTVTLPCNFTTLQSVVQDGEEVQVEIRRVVWCPNHLICQGPTPSVYDSEAKNNKRRYSYLGDKKGDCTLQITNVQKEDEATLRFRIETNHPSATFTGTLGVRVTVSNVTQMWINSSRGDRQIRRGENIILHCTARCAVHQLNITWFKDGHAFAGSGPALQLGTLTAKDSGNYTCGLKMNANVLSPPFSLQVEAEQEGQGGENGDGNNLALTLGLVFGVLLAVVTFVLALCIIRRKRAAAAVEDWRALGDDVEQKRPDNVHSDVLPSGEQQGGVQPPKTSRAADDVSYAAVQFRHKNQARAVQEAEDAVIYSSVASRG